jgi:hypothetical protein
MTTNFPTSLDAFTNPATGSALNSPSHAGQHADINDAMEAVQAKLGTGDHTVGVWQDYTPTFSGITVGNGTVTARYCQINKFVAWQVELLVGSTTVIGASRVTYPVECAQTWLAGNGGQVTFEDASSFDYSGTLIRYSTTQVNIYLLNASSTYLRVGSISATTPFTWAAGDRLIIQDFYEAA